MDREFAEQLVEQARAQGVELVGPNGLLGGLTKQVLEAGLEAEMTEHLEYERHDPAGHNCGNSRNGTRSKTVWRPEPTCGGYLVGVLRPWVRGAGGRTG